jgi:hypothetical protein
MRNHPEKYSTLVYHNNNNQNSLSSTSRDNDSNRLDVRSRQVTLPPPPYDEYIIEGYKAIMLEETEKLYKILVDQLVNESVAIQSPEALPSSLPALSLEGDDNKEHSEQNC